MVGGINILEQSTTKFDTKSEVLTHPVHCQVTGSTLAALKAWALSPMAHLKPSVGFVFFHLRLYLDRGS